MTVFSINNNDVIKDEKKTILLRKVAKLSEPIDIKEEILYDVGLKLSDDYKDAADSIIDQLIQEANQTATGKKVAEAEAKKDEERESEIAALRQEFDEKLNKTKSQYEEDIDDFLKDVQQKEEKNAEDIKALRENAVEEQKQAVIDERNRILNAQARFIARKKKRKYIGVLIAMGICIIIAAAFLCISLIGKETIPEGTKLAVTISSCAVGALNAIIGLVLFEGLFCKLKDDDLEKRERKKLEEAQSNEHSEKQ